MRMARKPVMTVVTKEAVSTRARTILIQVTRRGELLGGVTAVK